MPESGSEDEPSGPALVAVLTFPARRWPTSGRWKPTGGIDEQMSRAPHPRLALAPAVALAIAIAGCGGDEREGEEPRRTGPAASFDASNVVGQHSSVRRRGADRDGKQVREIHFVADGPARTHVVQARDCVQHYLQRGADAVYCFGYPSPAAFESAGFNPDTGRTSRRCWSARAFWSLDRTTDASTGKPQRCPDR